MAYLQSPDATSGTVTSVSVVTANGFAGTVANDTTTPAITISTSITGVLLGNGTAVSAFAFGTGVQTALGVAVGSAGAPVLFNGALGTPASGTLTNCTLPVGGITGLGAGVATLLAGTPSGTVGLVGTTSPTLITPVLGVATATSVAVGGATIGTDAAAIAGTVTISGGASLVPIVISSTDAGATVGPILDLYRSSASPAANDILAGVNFNGMSSTGVKRTYGSIQQVITTATNTAEDGALKFYTMSAGTLTLAGTLTNLGSLTVAGNFTGVNYIMTGTIQGSNAQKLNLTSDDALVTTNQAGSHGYLVSTAVDGTAAFKTRGNTDAAIITVNVLTTTGAITGLSYTSGAPSGGAGAGVWKFGTIVTAASVLLATSYVELDVGGTLVKLCRAQ